MERSTKKAIGLTIGVVALVLLSAGASALIMKEMDRPEQPAAVHHVVKNEKIHWNGHRQVQAAPAPAAATIEPAVGCDDNNIVGTGVGGVAGGVAGSQIGKGDGKTAATIAGTLGGAYLGNQLLPTRNVTCK
jgi:uncharacterized protein YcfJ